MDRLFLDANVLFSAAYREDAGLLHLAKNLRARPLCSKQIHLFLRVLWSGSSLRRSAVWEANFVFLAIFFCQRADALVVAVWKIGPSGIAFAVCGCQLREFFLQKWHEDFFRAGFQKQGIHMDELCSRLGC